VAVAILHHGDPGLERLRAEARAWLAEHAHPRRGDGDWSNGPRDASWEAEREYFDRCRRWQATLFDGGWAGITWPREFGGRGGTAAEAVVFAQEQAAFDVTSGFLASTIALVGPTLLAHGTREQCGRYLRPLLRGDEVWCQLFSEPSAGSDLANLCTRARRDGDQLVVDGQKVWTSGARHADHAILLARTDPDVPKHRGITYLLVDMSTPGIEVRPLRQITGAAHFNEVFLTEVRVPIANVVGEIDGGWAPARTTLMNESALIGGSTQTGSSVDALIAQARAVGGADDLVARQQLAAIWASERILSLLRDRLQADLLGGRTPEVDGSVLKVLWSRDRAAKGQLALALLGPRGTLAGADAPREGFWQTLALNRFWASIGGGTDEIHLTMIGERALGLPAEPHVDRDESFRALSADRIPSGS
jgi:alkylation response protein AidB-like acyl-CoA dehydrogenase